jgi:hypothetical protein
MIPGQCTESRVLFRVAGPPTSESVPHVSRHRQYQRYTGRVGQPPLVEFGAAARRAQSLSKNLMSSLLNPSIPGIPGRLVVADRDFATFR